MSRKLWGVLIVMTTLGATTALADGAQAAEFHCSVSPCRYRVLSDGTGKTAHWVLIIENSGTTESVSLTCSEVKGEGSTANTTASELTLENISYPSAGCTVNGSSGVEIVMNGCKYKLSSTGSMSIVGCSVGKKIEIKIAGELVFEIGEQGPFSGAEYHTIGASPNRELTVSTGIHGLLIICRAPSPWCVLTNLVGTLTTGNFILTGETSAGTMADAWFL